MEEDSCNSVFCFLGEMGTGQGSRSQETLGGLVKASGEPMAGALKAPHSFHTAVEVTTTLNRDERANCMAAK